MIMGMGMSADFKDTGIFDAFTRAESSLTNKIYTGTGLGMAKNGISGGRIWLRQWEVPFSMWTVNRDREAVLKLPSGVLMDLGDQPGNRNCRG